MSYYWFNLHKRDERSTDEQVLESQWRNAFRTFGLNEFNKSHFKNFKKTLLRKIQKNEDDVYPIFHNLYVSVHLNTFPSLIMFQKEHRCP